jgi:ParB-like chromosome segregation protein Spo0J
LSNIHKSIESLAKPIEALRVDPNNARSHGKESIDGIKVSLMQYGQVFPILVRNSGGGTYTCVAGSGRLTAAKELGWESLACIEWDGTAEQAKAFALVDNRTADMSDWDHDNLKLMVDELLSGEEAETLIALGLDDAQLLQAFVDDEAADSPEPDSQETFSTYKIVIYDPDISEDVMSEVGKAVYKYADLVEIK